MKLLVQQTAETDVEACYRALSDFDAILKPGQSGQMQITRLDAPDPISETSRWEGLLDISGMKKQVSIEVDQLSPTQGFVLKGGTKGVDARFSVDLMAISPEQTQITAEIDLQATSLSGKLLLKSLQMVQGHAEQRLASRLIRLL